VKLKQKNCRTGAGFDGLAELRSGQAVRSAKTNLIGLNRHREAALAAVAIQKSVRDRLLLDCFGLRPRNDEEWSGPPALGINHCGFAVLALA
jgi:hypothetical protein